LLSGLALCSFSSLFHRCITPIKRDRQKPPYERESVATESILEQYRIHDFTSWHEKRELILNPFFQRRSVWNPQAKVLLIDSILRRMPVPKIYMRTRIDTRTKRSIREVVDGQQRLRAILDFAEDKLTLTKRAGEFEGLKYSDLDEAAQQEFLSYPLAVDSLVNASDRDVLDVFARLNSYTVSLNPAEKRHAKFQGDFKWAVHNAASHWNILWEDFKVVSERDTVRMGDDSLMAELISVVMNGVTDGGAAQLEKLYKANDASFLAEDEVRHEVDRGLNIVLSSYGDLIKNAPLRRGPQFLLLFAATLAGHFGIPQGQLPDPELVTPIGVLEQEAANARLSSLIEALEAEQPPVEFARFVEASGVSTHRISTRQVRYQFFRWAISGGVLPPHR
jgi:hypothetical protein